MIMWKVNIEKYTLDYLPLKDPFGWFKLYTGQGNVNILCNFQFLIYNHLYVNQSWWFAPITWKVLQNLASAYE